MLEGLARFIFIIFTAAVTENAVFGRSQVTRKMLFPSRKLETAVFAISLTIIVSVSGIICYFFDILTATMTLPLYMRSVAYVVIIACTHLVSVQLCEKHVVKNYDLIRNTVLLASFNVAVLGTVLICSLEKYGFIERLGYFIGTGIGITMALVLVYVGRQSMIMSAVPKSFKGLPITLIYIGILSIAIYGLVGHQLPF